VKTVLEDSLIRFPASGDAPGFHVAQQATTLYSVRLWGRLDRGWAGNLSLGLALAGFNILRGFARGNRAERWVAEFLITPTASAPQPAAVDFLALSRVAHPEAHPGPVELSHFALDGSPDQGAALYLEVRGPDRIGFLGSLLRSLSELQLSPQEMTIGTRDGEVADRFLLRSTELEVPSDAARRGLARRLTAMLIASSPLEPFAPQP
jgi:hypothetical protein